MLAAALVAGGCGGGSSRAPADSSVTTLTALDLVAIVSPPPETPDGADYALQGPSDTLALADLQVRATTDRAKAEATTLARAGFRSLYRRTFDSSVVTVETSAYLFSTSSGAGRGLAALRRALAPVGGTGDPVAVDDLGDGAWSAHGTVDGRERTSVLWRSGAVDLLTTMTCPAACTFDAASTAHDYAREVDKRARDAG